MSDDGPFPAIGELVPHAPPMVALDAVEEWREGHLVARLVVRSDGPFAAGPDAVDSSAALEYMAQGVAACLGMGAYRGGESVRVGMVVACRNFVVERPQLAAGETYRVVADCVRGTDSSSQYTTRLENAQGATLATASMTLVHGAEPPRDS